MSITHQRSGVHSAMPTPFLPLPPTAPTAQVPSSAAINTLLQAGPSDAREPKRPDPARPATSDMAAHEHALTDLSARLDRKTVESMLHSPEARASKTTLNDINRLLTPGHFKCALNGPNAQPYLSALGRIETHLNTDSIEAILTPLETRQVEAYRKYVDATLFELKAQLMSAPLGSRFDMVRAFADKKHAPLAEIEDYLDALNARAKHLCDIATEVRKVNEPLQYGHSDDWEKRHYDAQCKQHPNCYTFINTLESTVERPCEIRDFVQGRDTLDVSSIGRQLNTPLHHVNRLSGASGEMQVTYSRANNASVLVISAHRGEPAFVAKIFGHVTEKDVVA